jgi:hypothetical protein
LTEELEAARELGRHSIHAATRKVRMADDDLCEFSKPFGDNFDDTWLDMLKDLRDRYEERGKYAPPAPEPENRPESVTR